MAFKILKVTILVLLRFTANSCLALNLSRASSKVHKPSIEWDNNTISWEKSSKENMLPWRRHAHSDPMVSRIKDSSSSIYNPNKVEERGQPCFTHMLLRIVSKIPYEVHLLLESISYKVKIATKPCFSNPKLLNCSMSLFWGTLSKAFLKSTKYHNTRDFWNLASSIMALRVKI